TVLAHLLTTGPLWEELRVRRGAYGASCHVDGLESTMSFSTYRDPRPVQAFGFFREALAAVAAGKHSSQIEEASLGAAGRDLKPLLPEERGLIDFKRSLYGITDEIRQMKRDEILEVDPEALSREAARLADACDEAAAVLISHAEDVKLLTELWPDTLVSELPM
ncbi:MAG: hypothetical protein Q8M76_15720, partial [Spirochaetaceae bacterium]|nr:hypothetical protein [Spirochaetaceae bacterium]